MSTHQHTDRHLCTFLRFTDRAELWTLRDTPAGPTIDTHSTATDLRLTLDERGEIIIHGDDTHPDHNTATLAAHSFQTRVPGIHHPGERLHKADILPGEKFDRGKIRRGDYLIKNLPSGHHARARYYCVTDDDGHYYSPAPATLTQARAAIDQITADEALLGRKSSANGRDDDNLRTLVELHTERGHELTDLIVDCIELYRARHGVDAAADFAA